MAYDRFDNRDDRPRWYNDRYSRSPDQDRDWGNRDRERGQSGREERGFFERAGDEIASWFGDDDAERHREREHRMEGRHRPLPPHERGREERGYRPITGDYGRGEQYAGDRDRQRSPARHQDPHYQSWRQQHMDELDRDYDDYRRENQSRFENDFGGWRDRRMQKRSLLGQIREHMEVVGRDDEHVGTVDRIAGDRIILAKSDPESGGAHHSLSCSDVDRVDGDRVILDCSADQARERWRDESRSRALFERDDQGEMGPRVLDRSFQGTYRD